MADTSLVNTSAHAEETPFEAKGRCEAGVSIGTQVPFVKYQALGNDYIVLDPRRGAPLPSPDQARAICDRKTGLGSDGILYGPIAGQALPGLRIINPDGSRAEKSGNGIRIFARYLRECDPWRGPSFALSTEGGQVSVELLDEAGSMIRVDMGRARFGPGGDSSDPARARVAFDAAGRRFAALALSMGNPHCVVFAEGAEDLVRLAHVYGRAIETHALFPERTNVQFARVRARDLIEIAIWERGAGYTEASGSSSCAVACAAFVLGLVDRDLALRMPGGSLRVELAERGGEALGRVMLTGPVERVAEGYLDGSLFANRGPTASMGEGPAADRAGKIGGGR